MKKNQNPEVPCHFLSVAQGYYSSGSLSLQLQAFSLWCTLVSSGSPLPFSSFSLSSSGSGVYCQITPEGLAGKAPSMGPRCLRLPVPLGPRNIPSSHLRFLLPASLRCFQGESARAGANQGTHHSAGLQFQGLASDLVRHKPSAPLRVWGKASESAGRPGICHSPGRSRPCRRRKEREASAFVLF